MNESAQTKIRPTGRESDEAILYALPLNQRPIPLTRTKEATASAEKTKNNLIRFIDGLGDWVNSKRPSTKHTDLRLKI